jgi:hypothetical protein
MGNSPSTLEKPAWEPVLSKIPLIKPSHDRPLNRDVHVPPEIVNHIYQLVLEQDVDGVILAKPAPLIGAYSTATNGKEPIIITSSCAL